jgi:hypothetical protein
MSYITEVADAIRSEVDPRLVPEGDTASLFRLYAVLALAKGTAVTPEDVHNAWAAWMSGNDPTHASIQPFDALSPTVQREDAPSWTAFARWPHASHLATRSRSPDPMPAARLSR